MKKLTIAKGLLLSSALQLLYLQPVFSLLTTAVFAVSTSGCSTGYVVPETPMPPNTVLLSQVMRDRSTKPGFADKILDRIGNGPKQGPAVLTPKLLEVLREQILGKDWQGLDRFPGWTMHEVTRDVALVNRYKTDGQPPGKAAASFIDLGGYGMETGQTVSIDQPSTLAPFTTDRVVVPLDSSVTHGDGAGPLASVHANSQRLADSFNRLAVNRLSGTKPFLVKLGSEVASTPEELVAAFVKLGFHVEIDDARYFANFGHLHYNGQDVMMPFWIDTEIQIPGTKSSLRPARTLLVPVSHAEYELEVRNHKGSYAAIAYYFGIDGKAEWRTMDTLDQGWVLKRKAHVYQDQNAVEVTRLTTVLLLAYLHQHERRPNLPFGGYYALGVCQDAVSAIERRMTGSVTLFPNTVDASLFDDSRDPEANTLMRDIPRDRDGKPPEPERVFGALPTSDLEQVTIPGLSADLKAVFSSWKNGTLAYRN